MLSRLKVSDCSEIKVPLLHAPDSTQNFRPAKMLAKGKNNLTWVMNGQKPNAVHGFAIRWINREFWLCVFLHSVGISRDWWITSCFLSTNIIYFFFLFSSPFFVSLLYRGYITYSKMLIWLINYKMDHNGTEEKWTLLPSDCELKEQCPPWHQFWIQ